MKTGTGSSFRHHFGEKPIFWVFLGPISPLLWGLRRSIFGAISYTWGLNIPGKFQGRSSRASYICHVSFSAFLAFVLMFGAVAWPQLDACVQHFSGVRYYVIEPTNVESFAFLARLVLLDMEASTLSFVQWQCRHRAFRACEISEVPTRISLPQLCVISTFCDEISRFPVFCGQQFFHPKVTVGLRNFTPLSRLIMGAL